MCGPHGLTKKIQFSFTICFIYKLSNNTSTWKDSIYKLIVYYVSVQIYGWPMLLTETMALLLNLTVLLLGHNSLLSLWPFPSCFSYALI